MRAEVVYTARERFWLGVLALVGVVGVNGVFLWAALGQPQALRAAFTNPVAAAFMAEALVLVGFLAYLLDRWRVSRLHWAWFVALSLLGSIVFALPAVLLWGRHDEKADRSGAPPSSA